MSPTAAAKQHQLRQSVAFLEALKTATSASDSTTTTTTTTTGKAVVPLKKALFQRKPFQPKAAAEIPTNTHQGVFKLTSPLSSSLRQSHRKNDGNCVIPPFVKTRLSTPAVPTDLQFAGWDSYANAQQTRFDAGDYRKKNEAMIVFLEEGIRASEAAVAVDSPVVARHRT